MKTNILEIGLILTLFTAIGTGCEKNTDNLWEISPENNVAAIQQEVNGIVFKFCLLNEKGEPATVFDEGRNFTFSFSISNNLNDTIAIPTEFINSEFYRVYEIQDKMAMGKPWTGIWCEFSLAPHIITLPPAKTKQLNCPWLLTDFDKPDYPLCKSRSNEPLPKGEYFTKLDLDFQYLKKGEKVQINDLIYTIKFEIQ